MKREILFKALKTDGKGWVEGHYVFLSRQNRHAIFSINGDFQEPINPNTVCQYTGLKVDGKIMLWEFDKVKVGGNVEGFIRYVGEPEEHDYEVFACCFVVQHSNGFFLLDDYALKNIRVTGNIHDKSKR
jgi:hypothetical protein